MLIKGITYPDEPPGLGEAIAKELMDTAYCFAHEHKEATHRLIYQDQGRNGHPSLYSDDARFGLHNKDIVFNYRYFIDSIPVLAVHRLDGTVVWEIPDYEAQVVKLALLSI